MSKDSILVPTKAILQLLNKDILDVVVDGKVQQKSVKVGATYGIYSIIENGITENDEIIVEGQNKVQVGQAVDPMKITKEQMEESAIEITKATTIANIGRLIKNFAITSPYLTPCCPIAFVADSSICSFVFSSGRQLALPVLYFVLPQ